MSIRYALPFAAARVLSLLPAAAGAAPRPPGNPHALGTQRGRGFASDGARFAAFNKSASEVRVFDGRTGKLFSIKTRCELLAGAAAHFLVECGTRAGDAPEPALLDVGKRKVIPLPGARPPYDGFSDMGDRWIIGATYHPDAAPGDPGELLYLNWRTGKRVERPRDEMYAPKLDSNSPGLAPIGPVPFARYLLFGYGRPWSAVRPLGEPSEQSPQRSGGASARLEQPPHRAQ